MCRQPRVATRCKDPVSWVLPRERDEGEITVEELRAGDLPECCAEHDDLVGEESLWYEESSSSSEPENHDGEDQEEAEGDGYIVRGRELTIVFSRAGHQITVTIGDVVVPAHQQEVWHRLP